MDQTRPCLKYGQNQRTPAKYQSISYPHKLGGLAIRKELGKGRVNWTGQPGKLLIPELGSFDVNYGGPCINPS